MCVCVRVRVRASVLSGEGRCLSIVTIITSPHKNYEVRAN